MSVGNKTEVNAFFCYSQDGEKGIQSKCVDVVLSVKNIRRYLEGDKKEGGKRGRRMEGGVEEFQGKRQKTEKKKKKEGK